MKRELITFFAVSFILLSIINVSALNADFAIYAGSGTWEHSIKAFEKFLEWKNLSWEEVNAWDINKRDLRPLYKGIFFPGGWAYNYKLSINKNGNQNIRNFISNGGVYIGMSAGAFYACDKVVWEGSTYDYPLKLFNGNCIGPINEIAPWPNYVMTTMSINKAHEANIYEPETEDILYYGEPYFIANAGQEMQVLASWIVPANPAANNAPGIIGFNYGKGRVLLVGPHPEIEENSDRDGTSFGSELNDNGSDWPFLWTATDWMLKKQISQPPESPLPPQIPPKNDTNTTIIFQDDFESCSLVNWILSGIDANWQSVSTDPYQGTCHAQARPMNTNEPASTMEKIIDTTGYTNVKVDYYRKLIGLDIADEFKAEWFDGSNWITLEQTPDSTDDASYISKQFTLPSSANNNPNLKIRFECTAGAVSETCNIDDVKVIAN